MQSAYQTAREFRLKAGLVVGGVFLTLLGVGDLWFNMGASSEPTIVNLPDLERGDLPDARYLEFGPHLALFPHGLYASESTSNDAPLEYVIYPIISTSHPDYRELADFEAGRFNELPAFRDADVLVISYDYRRKSEVPFAFVPRDSIRGMAANGYDSLNLDIRNNIKKQFPGMQYDKMIFLTENQSPSLMRGFLMLLGGVAMIGGGAVLVLKTS